MKGFGWSRYFKPYSNYFAAAILCMALNALATGLYAYLIGPLVKFIFVGALEESDSLVRLLSFLGLEPQIDDPSFALMLLPVMIISVALLKGLGQFGKYYLMGAFGEKAVFDIRAEMLAKLHRLRFERLDKEPDGELLSRMTQDSRLISEAATNALGSLFSDSMKLFVLLGVAFLLDWRLALVSFFILPLVAVPIVKIGRKLKKTSMDRQREIAAISSQTLEDIQNARSIRDFSMEATRTESFQKINSNYLKASLKSFAIRAFSSPLMELLGALGLSGTLFYAGWRLGQGTLVPEHFVSFFAAILLLYEPMKNLGRLNNFIQPGRAGAARIAEFLSWPEETGGSQDAGFDSEIRFESIEFGYGEKLVFSNLNLTLKKGECVALVGSSGAGKTSLTRILALERRPLKGRLLVDGKDLAMISVDSWRRMYARVEQRPLLFDDSIYNNIALGKAGAKKSEVLAAAELAGVMPFARSLEGGLDCEVGQGGRLLSEGQLQRIALARAFLKDAPIVILDEATSALDAENEELIAGAMDMLAKDKLVLVVAHRLSTVKKADRILVLENGIIVEEGSHSELLSKGGRYSELAGLQFGA